MHGFDVNWLAVLVAALAKFAIGGLWMWLFFRNLRKRPLLPLYDENVPVLLEPAHEH